MYYSYFVLVRLTASIWYKREAIMQNKQMVLLAQPAKVPSCKPAFLLPTLTAADRTSSGKILPAVCPTPPVVHVVEQVSLPSASMHHFGQDQANNYRLCKVARGQVGRKVHQDLTPLHLAEH